MNKNKSKIISAIYGARNLLNIVIIAIFLMMFSIVTINVFARYLFNSPISWAGELSRYSFIAIIFLGAIIAQRDNAHIGLDIIVEYFPEKLKGIIEFIFRILILIFLFVFVYVGIIMTIKNLNIKSSAMLIPMAIPYAVLPIGGLGMFFEQLISLLEIEDDSKGGA